MAFARRSAITILKMTHTPSICGLLLAYSSFSIKEARKYYSMKIDFFHFVKSRDENENYCLTVLHKKKRLHILMA